MKKVITSFALWYNREISEHFGGRWRDKRSISVGKVSWGKSEEINFSAMHAILWTIGQTL